MSNPAPFPTLPKGLGELFFKAENLSVAFGARKVLDGFGFSLREGETLGIVGSSGCGKTTLLNVVSGILKPATGALLLKKTETDEFEHVMGRRHFCSYMFQDHTLLPWRTLLRNVMLPGELVENGTGTSVEKRATDLLAAFDLAGSARLYPDQLSGGMRQRGSFARMFMAERPLYILDEPFSGADYVRQLKIERMLRKFLTDHRKSCILVTHDIEAALALCHRVLVVSGPPLHVRNEIPTGLSEAWTDPVEARETRLFSEQHKIVVETLRGLLDEGERNHVI